MAGFRFSSRSDTPGRAAFVPDGGGLGADHKVRVEKDLRRPFLTSIAGDRTMRTRLLLALVAVASLTACTAPLPTERLQNGRGSESVNPSGVGRLEDGGFGSGHITTQ